LRARERCVPRACERDADGKILALRAPVPARFACVPCGGRAWHAGESSWKGRTQCNDFSIGVELEGTGDAPFTDAQYGRLVVLTRALKARYPIRDIVGHSDVAPGRKCDPGPQFDWARYRKMIKKLSRRGTPRKRSRSKIRNRTAKTPRRQRKTKKR